MCGIAGAVALNSTTFSGEELQGVAGRMAATLLHRGPDGGGLWGSSDGSVVLAHRRLSIVDLSVLGRQPMSYADGRFQITFNGEIYNFRELSSALTKLGCTFRSASDTEVLLAAVAHWGLDETLQRIVGMFAFAIWDGADRVLHLARDRLGEKPLYIGQVGGYLYFASELRAFSAIPQFSGRVSQRATAAYLRDGYVPEPLSIFEGVHKLPPASVLTVPALRGRRLDCDFLAGAAAQPSDPSAIRPRRYWDLAGVATAAQGARLRDPIEARAELESRLRTAAREQMLCDVPVGAFLSGGVDSTLVTAVMQAEASSAVRTFTVAFDKPEFDESEHARRIAAHLGTNHEQVLLSEAEVVACVPHTVAGLDEPTANGSFFPVYLISKFARSRVTVALSGDGGDELFAGYNRYPLTLRTWQRLQKLPRALRALLGSLAQLPNYRLLDDEGNWLRKLLPLGSQASPGNTLAKLARLTQADSLQECYRLVTSCWPNPGLISGGEMPPERAWCAQLHDDLSRMLLADQLDYLPGDNLSKVDRASMAVSLETRLPLLDHRIVEFSWRVANELKLRGGTAKYLMRSVLERFVPRELTERRKMGFSVPTDQWLLGPLRDWAQDMLGSSAFRSRVPLAHEAVGAAWSAYAAGKRPSDYQMWALVMLAAWACEQEQRLPLVSSRQATDEPIRTAASERMQ